MSVSMSPPRGAEAQGATSEAALGRIWEEYGGSLAAGDLERWLALWTDDGLQLPPGGPMLEGKAAIRAANADFVRDFRIEFHGIESRELRIAGEWAFTCGNYRATMTPRRGGESVLIDGKFMSILARQPDGSWKIHRDMFNSNVP